MGRETDGAANPLLHESLHLVRLFVQGALEAAHFCHAWIALVKQTGCSVESAPSKVVAGLKLSQLPPSGYRLDLNKLSQLRIKHRNGKIPVGRKPRSVEGNAKIPAKVLKKE